MTLLFLNKNILEPFTVYLGQIDYILFESDRVESVRFRKLSSGVRIILVLIFKVFMPNLLVYLLAGIKLLIFGPRVDGRVRFS